MRPKKESGIEWIGEIPSEWDIVATKHLFQVISGATPKSENPDYFDGELIWITPADYKTEDVYVSKGRRNITEIGLNSCNTSLIPSGSIIFSKRAPIGSVAINKVELCTNQGCLACVPRIALSTKFYYYHMAVFTEQYNLLGSGTTFKEISATNFADFKLTFPPYPEQQVISAYLDRQCTSVNKIIEKTRDSIEEYRNLRKAVITQTITGGIRGDRETKDSGSAWFGDIPVEWDAKKLKYQFHIKKDIAGEEGHTVLSITQRGIIPKDLSKNEGQLAESYANYQLVNVGDFAMNHMDLLTGWIDISKYEGVTSPDYRVFVLDDTENNHSQYFLYLMQMCYSNRIFYGLGQGVSGLGRWRLQADKFLNFVIPIPPLDEQKEIAAYLDQKCSEIDALIAKKEQFLTELENYKKSMIYEYVTGKKEVPHS